jgi:Flp pilus assembly protein TadG
MLWMKRKSMMARGRNRRGSAVLDAALVFPILLSLTFGTVEFGYYFYIKHTLQGAAREGCRDAITGDGTTGVNTTVAQCLKAAGLQTSATVVDTTKFTLKIEYPLGSTCDPTTVTAGNPIYVTVQGTWGTLGSGFRPLGLISSTKVVAGVTAMRKEG